MNIKKIIQEEVDDLDWIREDRPSCVRMFMNNLVDEWEIFGDNRIVQSQLNTYDNKGKDEEYKKLIEELGKKISMYTKDIVNDVHGSIDCHNDRCSSVSLNLHYTLSERIISIYSNMFNPTEIYDNMDKDTLTTKRLEFPINNTLTKYI